MTCTWTEAIGFFTDTGWLWVAATCALCTSPSILYVHFFTCGGQLPLPFRLLPIGCHHPFSNLWSAYQLVVHRSTRISVVQWCGIIRCMLVNVAWKKLCFDFFSNSNYWSLSLTWCYEFNNDLTLAAVTIYRPSKNHNIFSIICSHFVLCWWCSRLFSGWHVRFGHIWLILSDFFLRV